MSGCASCMRACISLQLPCCHGQMHVYHAHSCIATPLCMHAYCPMQPRSGTQPRIMHAAGICHPLPTGTKAQGCGGGCSGVQLQAHLQLVAKQFRVGEGGGGGRHEAVARAAQVRQKVHTLRFPRGPKRRRRNALECRLHAKVPRRLPRHLRAARPSHRFHSPGLSGGTTRTHSRRRIASPPLPHARRLVTEHALVRQAEFVDCSRSDPAQSAAVAANASHPAPLVGTVAADITPPYMHACIVSMLVRG